MTITAKIILDSISDNDVRLTTMELRYPRFIHSEFMTHRALSRNASSSRAIPVEKIIQEVIDDPAIPERWGINARGMQDGGEMSPFGQKAAREDWMLARDAAVWHAQQMIRRPERAHKQIVNRILEPYAHIRVVVSATEWNNFFALRDHPAADPTIQKLAEKMHAAYANSQPSTRDPGDWHLPYVTEEDHLPILEYTIKALMPHEHYSEQKMAQMVTYNACRVSTARCARVSYKTHDGKIASAEEEMVLFTKLMGEHPLHASPAEHQATPDRAVYGKDGVNLIWEKGLLHGNFIGWVQHRKTWIGENKPSHLRLPKRHSR